MKQYNIVEAIYLSFFSRNLYRDVANRWGGRAFLYLLMVLFLAWLVPTLELQRMLDEGYRNNSNQIVSQVPVLTIKNGKISTPEERPYVIVNPKNNETLLVIDTTGQYSKIEQAKTAVLVTQTEVISQSSTNEVKTYKIPDNVNMIIDPVKVSGYLQDYLHFAWVPLFILLWLASYLYRIVQSLIYGLVGMLFTSIQGVALTYGQIVIITIVALTPAIIISTILDIFGVVFPFQLLLYFLISMVYLWFGIAANKTQTSTSKE